MFGRKTRERAAGKAALGAARGAGKAALGAGKVLKGGAKSKTARKAARGSGKVALKGGSRVLSPGESAGSRYLKYGFFALAGFAVGALAARSKGEGDVSPSFTGTTGQHPPDPGSPAGRRGETWGTGTSLGTAGVGAEPGRTEPGGVAPPPPEGAVPPPPRGPRLAEPPLEEPPLEERPLAESPLAEPPLTEPPIAEPPHQRPEEPSRTGAEREYSDPSSGPLIGRQHRPPGGVDIPEQQEEIEQRIRTRIGEDPRTLMMPRVNVEVNDGVAELRGEAPSEEAKEAAGEIASGIEGVTEVRNLISVS